MCCFRIFILCIAVACLEWPCLRAQEARDDGAWQSFSFSPGCDTLPLHAYFQVKGKYPESSQSLVKRAEVALAEHKTYTEGNGHLSFRILVDCAGKVAAMKLLQTNIKYEPCKFPQGLVDVLSAFVLSLKDWKPALMAGRPVNYMAYLSFKLESGHVVQVSP